MTGKGSTHCSLKVQGTQTCSLELVQEASPGPRGILQSMLIWAESGEEATPIG